MLDCEFEGTGCYSVRFTRCCGRIWSSPRIPTTTDLGHSWIFECLRLRCHCCYIKARATGPYTCTRLAVYNLKVAHLPMRAAGIMRFNREFDNNRPNITTTLAESTSSMANPVKCEYCGELTKPSLDLTWPLEPGQRRQQLCEILIEQRCTFERRQYVQNVTPSAENEPDMEVEDLLVRDRGMEDYNKLDFPSKYRTLPDQRFLDDDAIQLPVAETSAESSKALRFRLSCAPQKGSWTGCPGSLALKGLQSQSEHTQTLVHLFDHTHQFGLCHHQCVAGVLQKHYSNGRTFLTVFPDGSAQVFYPSGLLAVVLVTGETGRVCFVYEDSDAPRQTMRAVFLSDGRATCYHSNGNIWLSLNRAGGQCLDEMGARKRLWFWSSVNLNPTPLHPLFLPLNKNIGVRVLGEERVVVSFLARGKQAKFNVRSSDLQEKVKTDVCRSTVLENEQFLLATKIRIKKAIQHLA